MKKIISAVIITLVCFLAVNVHAASKRYEIKNAMVEYKISGAGQTGKETLYISDYGQKEARYTEMAVKLMGFKSVTKTLSLYDQGWVYDIDLKEKKGEKYNESEAQKIAQRNTQGVIDSKMTGVVFDKDTLNELKGAKKGSETLLGKKCQIYELQNGAIRASIYKGIALKTESVFGGMKMTYTATSFDEKAAISQDKFEVPSGVKIEKLSFKEAYGDMPDMQDMGDQDIEGQLNDAGESDNADVKNIKKKAFGLLKSMF